MDELSEIIKGCKKQKPQYQQKLYEQYSAKLFGVCRYYSDNYEDAQDTLQEGFVLIFSRIKQYTGKGSFEGWMRRVIVNVALEKHRRKKPLYNVSDVYQFEAVLNYNDIIENISAKDLLELIKELSPQYKIVFNLFAIEGYSHKEIAKELGISEGTSKSNLARARGILQEKVKKHFKVANVTHG